MHHYRQALLRMRQGDSDREIAAARVMGRRTAAKVIVANHQQHHWLDPAQALPEDGAIAAALGAPKRAGTTVSALEMHRPRVQAWFEQGVTGVAMCAALKREHGWSGSYSAVRRILRGTGASMRRENGAKGPGTESQLPSRLPLPAPQQNCISSRPFIARSDPISCGGSQRVGAWVTNCGAASLTLSIFGSDADNTSGPSPAPGHKNQVLKNSLIRGCTIKPTRVATSSTDDEPRPTLLVQPRPDGSALQRADPADLAHEATCFDSRR